MKRTLRILFVALLLVLVAVPVAYAIWYITVDISVGRPGDDNYATYVNTNGFPAAMMWSDVVSQDPWGGCTICWRTTGWHALGMQGDETWVNRKWSDSGQTAPSSSQCGCVKGCVLVGWPPTEHCDIEGDPPAYP